MLESKKDAKKEIFECSFTNVSESDSIYSEVDKPWSNRDDLLYTE